MSVQNDSVIKLDPRHNINHIGLKKYASTVGCEKSFAFGIILNGQASLIRITSLTKKKPKLSKLQFSAGIWTKR